MERRENKISFFMFLIFFWILFSFFDFLIFLNQNLQKQRQTLEIVKDFACEWKNPEKSSEISQLLFLHIFHYKKTCFLFEFLIFPLAKKKTRKNKVKRNAS